MTPSEKAPEWHSERFYKNTVKPELEKNGELIMDWFISKPTMIATINYLRTVKKLKCEWIEKDKAQFLIKVSKP